MTGPEASRRARRDIGTGLALSLALTVLVDVAVMVVPVYDMQLYDRVIQSRNMDTMAALSIACVVGLGLYALVDYLRSAVFVVIADRVSGRLHVPVLAASVRRRNLDSSGSGGDGMRDLNEIRVFISSGHVAVPLDAACAPLLLAVMFMLHPAYGFLGLCGICVMILFGLAAEHVGRPAVVASTEKRAAMALALASRLRDPVLTEALGMLPAVAARWHAGQMEALDELRRATGRAQGIATGAQVVRLLVQSCLMSAGAVMILAHSTTPGSLMGANMLLAKTLAPFDGLVEGWRHWSLAHAAWRRLSALLSSDADHLGDAGLPDAAPGLDANGIRFSAAGRAVLDDVTFSVPPGAILGVSGANGSGKSTLLRILAGVTLPAAGHVSIDGFPVTARLGRVGYLPQSVGLLEGTIGDNVGRFRDRTESSDATIEACRRAGVHGIVGRLRRGYDTDAGSGGAALSGGQHQRVGLARALFDSPRLLILDEPDASVDHEGEAALLSAMADAKSSGAVVVVVSHRPGLMRAVDWRLVLEGGRVASFGPTARTVAAVASKGASA